MTAGTEPLWRLPAVRHLLVVSFLGFSSFCLTLAALPTWAAQAGASAAVAGLVTTVMLGVTVATQGLVPWAIERAGSGPALALGLLLLGAPTPLCGLSGGLGVLLPVSAVRGVGFALLTVIGATLTGQVAPAARHGESVGLYGLAIALPNLGLVPLGVALTQAGHFPLVAGLAACPLLAVPLAVRSGFGRRVRSSGGLEGAKTPDSTANPDSTARLGVGGAQGAGWSRRRVVLLTLAPSAVLLLVTAAGGGFVTFLPIERPSGALATAGLLGFGAAAALARWRAGTFVDRFGPRVLLPASIVAVVGGLGAVAGALLGGAAYDPVLLVGAVVFGLGYGAVQNVTLVIAFARAGSAGAPTASAVWNAAFDAGTALGAFGVGALADTGLGLPWSFAVAAGAVVVVLPVGLRLRADRGPR